MRMVLRRKGGTDIIRWEKDNGREKKKSLRVYGGQMLAEKGFWNGSYTVEAAMVVSIVIFVLSALVIASFYVHDCAVFQSYVCEIAAAGSSYATEDERENAVTSGKKEVKAARFLGSRELSGTVSAEKNKVTASWSAAYPVPGFAMKYLADSELSIDVSWSSKIVAPADTIRLIRGAGELITGGDE
ncbi:MAG: hypothetical protein LUI07_04545 [Lachnospiraceae bacterium]|nr:hypothetical protein [Lachnospiraceae bacterium]